MLVLDEFDLMTAVAPKAAKTIEELASGTFFVVLADELPPELVTIASRCVRIEFGPVPVALVEATLEAEGAEAPSPVLPLPPPEATSIVPRLLVADSGLATRRQACARHPEADRRRRRDRRRNRGRAARSHRRGGRAAQGAAEEEAERLQQRIEQSGERGSGRKELEDRRKRELRRHRTDELRFGLATLTGAYRDRLVAEARVTTLGPSISSRSCSRS